MAYTALEKMRAKNRAAYGKDVGPAQPALFGGGLERTDLKSAALRFLHERCEELRFNAAIEKKEEETSEAMRSALAGVKKGDVIMLQSTNESYSSEFIGLGLTGGNYYKGASI